MIQLFKLAGPKTPMLYFKRILLSNLDRLKPQRLSFPPLIFFFQYFQYLRCAVKILSFRVSPNFHGVKNVDVD